MVIKRSGNVKSSPNVALYHKVHNSEIKFENGINAESLKTIRFPKVLNPFWA